jgi:hypothetical protein
MSLSKIASFIDPRWVTILALIYAVVAGVEIQRQIDSASYNGEVYPEHFTGPFGGQQVVEYAFSAQHQEVDGLWVYIRIPPKGPFEGRLFLSVRRAGEETPFWSQSFDIRRGFYLWRAQLCHTGGLTLKKGEHYVLTYALPDMKTSDGWRVSYCPRPHIASTIAWEGQVKQSAEATLLWLGREPRYPLRNVLVGITLLVLCCLGIKQGSSFRAPALITMTAICMLLATWHWQQNLWMFWGNFWPDGYPKLSYHLFKLFSGASSPGECLQHFQTDRSGQAFFVPLIMAIFQALGLSVKGSYLATNALSLIVAAWCLVELLRIHGVTGDRPFIAIGLLFFGHRCIIGAVSELQTDLAGVAATMTFLYTLSLALAATNPRRRVIWFFVCGFVAFLACTVRLALLSLPLIPACLFLWSLFFERQRPWRERLEYLIPTVISVVLVWDCWTALGLWATLEFNWIFADMFRRLFSWKDFVKDTLLGVQLGLLIAPLLWRRLFDDRAFAAVTGTAFSLVALLAYTRCPEWLRYWDPPAAVAAVMFIWLFKAWPNRERILLAIAWVAALANTAIP